METLAHMYVTHTSANSLTRTRSHTRTHTSKPIARKRMGIIRECIRRFISLVRNPCSHQILIRFSFVLALRTVSKSETIRCNRTFTPPKNCFTLIQRPIRSPMFFNSIFSSATIVRPLRVQPYWCIVYVLQIENCINTENSMAIEYFSSTAKQ